MWIRAFSFVLSVVNLSSYCAPTIDSLSGKRKPFVHTIDTSFVINPNKLIPLAIMRKIRLTILNT
jgi:hypothetical protein